MCMRCPVLDDVVLSWDIFAACHKTCFKNPARLWYQTAFCFANVMFSSDGSDEFIRSAPIQKHTRGTQLTWAGLYTVYLCVFAFTDWNTDDEICVVFAILRKARVAPWNIQKDQRWVFKVWLLSPLIYCERQWKLKEFDISVLFLLFSSSRQTIHLLKSNVICALKKGTVDFAWWKKG